MFEIFVDSAANIPAELVKAFKIKVLSFVNLVNGKEMTCFDPDLTPEEERQKGKDYYDMVRAGADIKTGLISSGVFEMRSGRLWRRIKMCFIFLSVKISVETIIPQESLPKI